MSVVGSPSPVGLVSRQRRETILRRAIDLAVGLVLPLAATFLTFRFLLPSRFAAGTVGARAWLARLADEQPLLVGLALYAGYTAVGRYWSRRLEARMAGGEVAVAVAPPRAGRRFVAALVALAVVVVAALVLTPLDKSPRPVAATPAASPKTLLRNPAFLAVVLASSMVQGSHAFYYGFSAVQWRAEGLDGRLIGLLWGLGVLAEIVLFALSARLPKSLPPTALLAIGGVGAVIRWTAMAFDTPVALLPALQLLHAASFGAAHLGMMGFLARAVPRELAATAQGFAATWSGIVNASATFASGFVYAATGSFAYLLMAAMALIGLISALYAGRR